MARLELVAYEYAAAVLGRTPWEVSRDEDLLVEAHRACLRRHGHRAAVCGIDVYNLEAEALGAQVSCGGGDDMPTIVAPIRTLDELLREDRPVDPHRDGRLVMTLRAAARLKAMCPDVRVSVPLAGPFSVVANLIGYETLLCAMIEEADRVGLALERVLKRLAPWHETVQASGLPACVFESGAAPPMLPPTSFAATLAPALHAMLKRLSGSAGRPALIIGGDAAAIIDQLLSLPVSSLIAPNESDQSAIVERSLTRPDLNLRVNMDGRLFARGTKEAVEREWRRAVDLAARHPRGIVGSGVLPFDADPALVDHVTSSAMP